MAHAGFAPCFQGFAPGAGGPPQTVVVTIIDVDPDTDLEGDDDAVPFYDNHADIYGYVTIDGEEFALPQMDDNDHPHWDFAGPYSGVFEKTVTSNPVAISIRIWEADSGLTGDDTHVKINPEPGKRHLDFMYDMCDNTVSGDVNASAQGKIESVGGSGKDTATIRFTIGLKDGRPPTTDDLALTHLDLIQVVPQTDRLVARKGTVALVGIANNHAFDLTTNLRIRISGGVSIDKTFPIEVRAGEVKKTYLFTNNPFTFPATGVADHVAVIAEIDDPGSSALPGGDCRRSNDRITSRIVWKVVTTNLGFSLLWAKVGLLLDVGNYVPDAHFDEIHELGTSFIGATFPLRDPWSDKDPFPFLPPKNSAATEFILAVLSAFPYSPDNVEPVVFLFELNGVAALTGYDRLMGVLPNKDWFKRFDLWEHVTGFSLGEFAPRAVIFVPRKETPSGSGVPWTLPAHELGHTFGLSTDSRLKQSWVCDVDWPVLGSAACGLVGGFDEYEHKDEDLKDGNPARGYWVRTGSEPSVIAALNSEQCNAHCFMGTTPADPHLNWGSDKRWIDAADYSRLIDKLAVHPDPEVIYVSGMISWADEIHLGPWYRFDEGFPDHTSSRGMYEIRFVDESGQRIGQFGIPVAWNHAEFKKPLPITFFGVTVEFPRGASTVEIWNRGTNRLLASRRVDLHVPEVHLNDLRQPGNTLQLTWTAQDEDPAALTYAVMVSADGVRWWPAAHGLEETLFELDLSPLAPGRYQVKILAINSVRVGESNHVAFRR